MSEIDIRGFDEEDVIDKIVFAESDEDSRTAIADFITNKVNADLGTHKEFIYIEGSNNGHYSIIQKKDLKNFIKALEKAVELGWDK